LTRGVQSDGKGAGFMGGFGQNKGVGKELPVSYAAKLLPCCGRAYQP